MKKFIRADYQEVKPSALLEAIAQANNYDDVINFSIGDPDLGIADELLEAATADVIANHYTHYSDPKGYSDLREAIAQGMNEDFNLTVAKEDVLVTAGGTIAMFNVLHAIIEAGDEVVIFEPFYSTYAQQITMCNGVVVVVKLKSEEDFQINIDELDKHVTDKTKAIIINTPNNPTGTVYTRETLEKLAEYVNKKDLLVIADDIYSIYHYGREFIPFATMPNVKPRCITIRSFSKDYIMTGLRLGYVVADPYFIKVLDIINEGIHYSASSFSQRVAYLCLLQKKKLSALYRGEFDKRINYAYQEIKNFDFLDVSKPQGSIYLFVDIRKTGLSSFDFQKKLLELCHILVVPGSAFGASGEGFVRLALTLSIDKMKEAFERLRIAHKNGNI
jgi:aspartate/methionine/tyrosine aminotransferase